MESPNPDNQNLHKRRTFLKSSLLPGTFALSAFDSAASDASERGDGQKLRIGALCVGEFSFWSYSWGDILTGKEKVNRGTLGTGLLNMEITHVWDVDYRKAETFAAKVGAEPVKRYDDMIGKVDGVAFGGYYEVPWQHKLARPYIEAGIPTYLSRPFAYSLHDIDGILECAAKHNTPIMATDVYEHLYVVKNIRSSLENIGEIQCVHSTCLTQDYPALFHTQFMNLRIFGDDIRWVSVLSDNPNTSTYLVGTYLFNGGPEQRPFLCISTMTPDSDLFTMTVTGTQGTEASRLPRFADWKDDLMVHHLPLLIDMQRTFEGSNLEPFDRIRKKTEIFLTGFYSAVERHGAPVNVGTLPPDWRAIPARPDWIDEKMFD